MLQVYNIGASRIRTGFWGQLFDNYNKNPPPPNSIGNYLGPYSRVAIPGFMWLLVVDLYKVL